jgi:plasmid stability protein
MAMRNVTLALDEAMLRELKVIAARRGTSMSAIVREQIEEVVARGEREQLSPEFLAARERALALMKKGAYRLPEGYKLDRDELYDRG